MLTFIISSFHFNLASHSTKLETHHCIGTHYSSILFFLHNVILSTILKIKCSGPISRSNSFRPDILEKFWIKTFLLRTGQVEKVSVRIFYLLSIINFFLVLCCGPMSGTVFWYLVVFYIPGGMSPIIIVPLRANVIHSTPHHTLSLHSALYKYQTYKNTSCYIIFINKAHSINEI